MTVGKAGEIQLHWSMWEKGNGTLWYLLELLDFLTLN